MHVYTCTSMRQSKVDKTNANAFCDLVSDSLLLTGARGSYCHAPGLLHVRVRGAKEEGANTTAKP